MASPLSSNFSHLFLTVQVVWCLVPQCYYTKQQYNLNQATLHSQYRNSLRQPPRCLRLQKIFENLVIVSLNFCKSRFFRFSNLQDKGFDVLIDYLLLCLGALICVLALSIGIEGKRGKLSRPNWREAIKTLLITKDVWFDAFRYKCILTYLNEIRASPQGRVFCASKVSIYPTFAMACIQEIQMAQIQSLHKNSSQSVKYPSSYSKHPCT